jgi:hypothetical protein
LLSVEEICEAASTAKDMGKGGDESMKEKLLFICQACQTKKTSLNDYIKK